MSASFALVGASIDGNGRSPADSVEKRVSGNALTGCVRASKADQVLNDSGRMRP
jgi:hypothetical protein